MHLIMFCTGYFKCLQDLPYTVSCWSAPALCVCVCVNVLASVIVQDTVAFYSTNRQITLMH